ncbi:hypothetical protein FB45DRAFT_908489 [Roridomyces roridus]|uniref:Arrestin-like N-terminal domain-containing protein n=1 Tax=Roridomyces roridus TaxID=1738132 RepID=A0AAD7FQC5_9AGAR|nr:hypothetical protein FB45DRAFT_908489 [Roridomyces roridus]
MKVSLFPLLAFPALAVAAIRLSGLFPAPPTPSKYKNLAPPRLVFPPSPSANPATPCDVQVKVRAEDLGPNHSSQGELRVKASRPDCAHEIVSVALRLELSEFSEVVSAKDGVALPEAWLVSNQTKTVSGLHGEVGQKVVYNFSSAYAEAISDPELWNIAAEERIAWTSEIVLLKDHPDLTHPVVVPFTVDVPNVNYPSGVDRMRVVRNSRHSYGDLAYEYTATVTFTDGRILNKPIGYTTFVPINQVSPTTTPSTWRTAFENPCEKHHNREDVDDLQRCLPKKERSQFTAKVTLETGNVVQQGHRVKGRVTVHGTQGSTTMSEIAVGVLTHYDDRWASEQAITGGDAKFVNHRYTDTRCRTYIKNTPLDAESSAYAWIFTDGAGYRGFPPATLVSSADEGNDPLTPEHPYFDFDFEVPRETPVDFASYYTITENRLLFKLDVLYAPEVADCLGKPMPRPPVTAADAAAATEESLWQSHSPVRHPVEFKPPKARKDTRRVMTLEVVVPIIVVGGTAEINPVPHYLAPGLPVPVIRAGGEAPAVSEYPIADPVVKEEPLTETTSRLIEAHPQSSRFTGHRYRPASEIPDPARYYRRGDYAGLLWKKKKVAEERGFVPFRPETAETEVGGNQQPLGL